MKISTLIYISFLSGIFFLTSCSDSRFDGYEKGENGVYYKVHYQSGDTSHPRLSDWVTVNMDYRLDDTVLFRSSTLGKSLRFSMIEPMFYGDLYEALKIMSVGDSMTFAVVADSFYLKTAFAKKLPKFVKPGSLMYYDVKLNQVLTDKEFSQELEAEKLIQKEKEQQDLDKYLSENNISTKPLESGLYFISKANGNGKVPDTGDVCSIFLEVKLLDGNVLFNNFDAKPLEVEFGKLLDTEGLMLGLGMLKVGGQANLIVPSSIGVGEVGNETVPPFTTIFYDVKLLEIK